MSHPAKSNRGHDHRRTVGFAGERIALMIVQELTKIQQAHGYLPTDELKRLGQRTKTHLHRIHEVASFFPHLRISPPAHCEVHVCRDFTCHLRGAPELIARGRSASGAIGDDGRALLHVSGVSCLGRCDRPVAVSINDSYFTDVTPDRFETMLQEAARGVLPLPRVCGVSRPHWKIDPYAGRESDYAAIRGLVPKEAQPVDTNAVFAKLREAGLVGKGGPGLPLVDPGTGPAKREKWEIVADQRSPQKYVVCNGDESEPGTFKDRELLLCMPHLVVEGVIAACLTVGATKGYVYIRHEYPEQIEAIRSEIERARRMGACGKKVFGSRLACDVEVFVSPGGYICGEQTALIEAMEDHRAEPRQQPPNLAIQGLFGKPTLVNNVETLAWVPSILLNGGKWYADHGSVDSEGNPFKGMRFVSVSGDVANPGVYEIPMGTTVGQLLEICGGMTAGLEMGAFATSGPSGGFLPRYLHKDHLTPEFAEKYIAAGTDVYDLLNLPLDNKFFRDNFKRAPYRFSLGAAHAFFAKGRPIAELAVNATEFYRNESCGKCVPCRVGGNKLVHLGRQMLQHGEPADLSLIKDLADVMGQASICGLGKVAANPLLTVLRFFPEHLRSR